MYFVCLHKSHIEISLKFFESEVHFGFQSPIDF